MASRDFRSAEHLPNLRDGGQPADPDELPRQRNGVTPQMHGRYPDYNVLDEADHWDETTRRLVFERVEQTPPIRFFTKAEADTLSIDPVIPAALDGLKCEISLLGRLIEVHYRVGQAGCGVSAIELNGDALALSHASNPHRRGAARVSKASFTGKLRRERNLLSVRLG